MKYFPYSLWNLFRFASFIVSEAKRLKWIWEPLQFSTACWRRCLKSLNQKENYKINMINFSPKVSLRSWWCQSIYHETTYLLTSENAMHILCDNNKNNNKLFRGKHYIYFQFQEFLCVLIKPWSKCKLIFTSVIIGIKLVT